MDRVSPPTVGIVLSGGASQRWQGAPKALLRIGGTPALRIILARLRAAGIRRLVVVVGPDGGAIRAGSTGPGTVAGVSWRTNPDRASGAAGSLRAGLIGIPPEARIVLWPVDHPLVAPGTLPRLLAAAAADAGAAWVQPEYRGRGGHPVVLSPAAWGRAAGLPSGASLRSLRDSLGAAVRRVAVEDPGVTVNLNTPEVFREAVEGTRRHPSGGRDDG